MAALDWAFLVVVVASMLLGAWRGLVFEVLSVLGWVVAFFSAQWFAADVAQRLPWRGDSDTLRYAVGFLLVFVAAVFACGMVAWLAKKLVEAVGLRPADRALGAAFGGVRALVLLLVVTVLGGLTSMHQTVWWQESQGARWLNLALRELRPVLPEEFGRHLPS